MPDRIMDDASIALVRAANLPISLPAIEEIIAEEDSDEAFYKSHYQHPEWPGGPSGVTILLGYDLGYASPAKIHRDLDGKVPASMVQACVSVSGITGSRAHDAMLRVRSQIDMPWSVALQVFLANDMPEWIETVRKYLPNTELLSPDCLGVLVSVAYNRGPSFNNTADRYREMRAIKADMAAKNFADIPAQFRSMARLWPVGNGVHSRRFREAALFERGLRGTAMWVQHQLNLIDVEQIAEDGDFGPATRAKVLAFRASRGLQPGDVDDDLLCALDLAVAEKEQRPA